MSHLTSSKMIELIVDIAYQQATREISGINWFKKFVEKIKKMENEDE